jgi:hypothetical protein
MEQEFSDNIQFIDGAVKFSFNGSVYQIKKPSALKAVGYDKKIKALDAQDIESVIRLYIDSLVDCGLPKDFAESLDAHTLSELFKAILSPAPKKK